MGNHKALDSMMELRVDLLSGPCDFHTEVTADYGDKVYTFGMYCQGDTKGNLGFEVTAPDTIAGIAGSISGKTGKLTFEDTALTFPLLADGQVAPVSAPYLLLKTLQGGYVRSAGEDGDLIRVTVDDSYEEDSLQLDIWLDGENLPVRAEVLYGGRRILSMEIKEFHIS